jgi:hypothetical protein
LAAKGKYYKNWRTLKMSKTYSHLPESIVVNGITLRRIVAIDRQFAMNFIKENKLKYRNIKVLSPKLKGKLDIHNKPYSPTEWLFAENTKAIRIAFDKKRNHQ